MFGLSLVINYYHGEKSSALYLRNWVFWGHYQDLRTTLECCFEGMLQKSPYLYLQNGVFWGQYQEYHTFFGDISH